MCVVHFFSPLSFAHTSQLLKIHRTDVSSDRTEVSQIRDAFVGCVLASRLAARHGAGNMRKRCVPCGDGRKRKRLIGGFILKIVPRRVVFKSEHETSFPLARDHTQVRAMPHTCVPRHAGARARPCPRSSTSGKIANRLGDRSRTSRTTGRHARTRWRMLEIDLLGPSTNPPSRSSTFAFRRIDQSYFLCKLQSIR